MNRYERTGLARRIGAIVLALLIVTTEGQAWGQPPLSNLLGTKPADPPAAAASGEKPQPAPTRDNPDATVTTTSGPIKVQAKTDDKAVEKTLEDLLPRYPGVRSIDARVTDGTVELDGQVQDDDIRDQMTSVTAKVEGVHLVINRLKTDVQVMTAREFVMNELTFFWTFLSRKWLLILLALAVVMAASLIARAFNAYSERLLAPFVGNVLLRSVLGSFIGTGLVIGGMMLALSLLNLTHVVLSIVGFAGVIGLAVGFAFRDIAENFIASILLGIRRPFRVGDYVTVAGHAGVVKSLNTRATVLVTLEGNHVRIPNNVIYKEILVNASASPSARGSFDVIIPYEVSTSAALDAMTNALRAVDGLSDNPPARALVEALEPTGVRVRSYFWMPVIGVDGFKLNSDARMCVKVALQQVGIMPPPVSALVSIVGRVPVEMVQTPSHEAPPPAAIEVARPGSVVTPEQAQANLEKDAAAVETANAEPPPDRPTPIEHVLHEAETRVSEEGTNLLGNGKA